MKRSPLLALGAATLLLSAFAARAETVAAPAFGSHMVIQRGRPVPVWGTDAPGTRVSITFNGRTVPAVADKNGAWRADLPALTAGGPYELAIKGTSELKFDDVLVGDVWFAAGQSNMAFRLADEAHAAATIPAADYPKIRFARVPLKASREPFRPEVQWRVASPATVPEFSAVAFYFARDLFNDLKVPIGVIDVSWGGTLIQPWVPLAALEAHPDFKNLRTEWDKKVEHDPVAVQKGADEMNAWYAANNAAEKNGTQPPPRPEPVIGPDDSQTPGLVFQSMTQPFVPFAIRGFIWYQGESNGWEPAPQYLKLFTLMITEWRKAWNQPDLPFLFVQLPNYIGGNPTATNWADVRGAQAQTLELPHTGMAVTIDVGDTKDIHPKNKLDVGQRLALVARNTVYGERVPFQGPTFKRMSPRSGALVLQFDHTEGGLAVRDGGTLQGFEIAGPDGNFQPADAKITSPDSITLTAAADAKQIRYAWRNDPQPPPNLINSAKLPAPPFQAPVK